MKKICVTCDKMKDESEFDWWFKSIGVRKRECRECERLYTIRWWLRELTKQRERERRRKNG
jgi:hypothetical protein